MKRLIWLPVAGFLLIAGAAAAAAAAPPTAAPSTLGETETTPSNVPPAAGSFLADVLTDLVANGTITQEQSDAINEAVDTKLNEKRAEMEQRREEMQAAHEQLRAFLEDGVITQEELDQLPADHPLRNLDTILDDGQITLEELGDIGGRFHGFGPGGRFGGPGFKGEGRGHGFGGPGHWLAPDDENDSSAQPSPTNT